MIVIEMFIYHYHEHTKEFLCKTNALLDPLETRKQRANVYLCPANGTTIPPPYIHEPEKYIITWDEPTYSWKVELKPPPPPPPPPAPPIETILENDVETQTEPVLE